MWFKMSENISLKKVLAAVTIIGLLTFGFTFSFYKAINEYIDGFVLQILNFLDSFNIYLSVDQFWIILAILFFLTLVVIFTKSD